MYLAPGIAVAFVLGQVVAILFAPDVCTGRADAMDAVIEIAPGVAHRVTSP